MERVQKGIGMLNLAKTEQAYMKKTMIKRSIGLLGCTLLAMALQAQTAASYSCDFENEAQNATWSLVNGTMATDIPNKWAIGTAANNGGAKGLYISSDGGQTAGYVKFSSYAVCYTDIILQAGTFDMAFDWRGMGDTDMGIDGLYVCWVPDREDVGNDSIQLVYNTSTQLSAVLQQYAIAFGNGSNKRLSGNASWQTARCQITSDGSHRRLAFIWLTSATGEVATPGACIDNISIIDSRLCPMPADLKVTQEGNQQVRLTWSGSADQYEVRCYSYVDKQWRTQTVQDTTCVFLNLSEGLLDFYVRTLCDEGLQSITATASEFLYYPERHCIDYLSLDSTNCYVANETVVAEKNIDNLTWKQCKVDFGYESKASRHTIHTSQSETDPRTCGGLKTVPDGEIASVRLGNWNTGGEAERVEFQFHVDAIANPVLLLKYAVVLQKPGDACKPNPGFLLRVLDKNGKLVSKCASADFDFKAAADAEWEACMEKGEVRWKDWTTVGVNLADFDGEDLTIQLTTYDCGGGGHYGYAYFTLGCSNGKLTGLSCGVENLRFTAPDGFAYRWYKATNPTEILSRNQVFEVESQDTCHYKVDLMFEQDSTCYFTLTASAQPYLPVAEANYTYTPQECRNDVQFIDRSHIKETNQITGEVTHTDQTVDYIQWDFGDGTTSYALNPTHTYPNTGGTYTVTQTAYFATCTDLTQFTITLPEIGTQYDTLHVQQCKGTTYTYRYTDKEGQTQQADLTESGLYNYTMLSSVGCDSIVTVDLALTDTVFVTIDTLIMRGETYTMGGKDYTETGEYTATLRSASGCDSVVTLHLEVYDKLIVTADSLQWACSGDPNAVLTYRVVQGKTSYYSLAFEDERFEKVTKAVLPATATDIEFPIPDVTPNRYPAVVTFHDSISGDVAFPLVFELRYAGTVITQRWNDVIALYNTDYNGGYDFVRYQWYKNGTPIEGATLSYLYEPQGLDLTAEYAALVERSQDGVALMTCAFTPQSISKEEKPDVPTLIEAGETVRIRTRLANTAEPTSVKIEWVAPCGMVLGSQTVTTGDTMVQAPSQAGFYLLVVRDQSARILSTTSVIVH